MTIELTDIKHEYRVLCNFCGYECLVGPTTEGFSAVVESIRSSNWKIYKKADEYQHKCPSCVAKEKDKFSAKKVKTFLIVCLIALCLNLPAFADMRITNDTTLEAMSTSIIDRCLEQDFILVEQAPNLLVFETKRFEQKSWLMGKSDVKARITFNLSQQGDAVKSTYRIESIIRYYNQYNEPTREIIQDVTEKESANFSGVTQ